MRIQFTVPGAPVGKGRPKAARRGNFITMYTPEKTASYENLVKIKAQEAMKDTPPFEGACLLQLAIYAPIPASWSIKKKAACVDGLIHPTSKPDIDNVLKGICDAMNGIVFNDDKQIIGCTITKQYGITPQAVVAVTFLGGGE